MDEIPYEKIISVAILIRYMLMESSKKTYRSLTDLAKEEYPRVDPTHLKGFLNGQQRSRKLNKADAAFNTQLIVDRTKEIFAQRMKDRGSPALPRYIIETFHAAYPDPADSIIRDAVAELSDSFAELDLDGHLSKTRRLKELLGGKVYDIFRWCGPTDASNAASSGPETARAMRAAIQFYHPTRNGRFIQFRLHYKPYEIGSSRWTEKKANESKGLVVPIGDYLWLIGNEVRSRFPLVIAMQQVDPENPNQIGGLVVRKADTKGQLFTSRIFLRLNAEAKRITELSNDIGIIREDDLGEDEKHKLETFSNQTGLDGKQALILLNA